MTTKSPFDGPNANMQKYAGIFVNRVQTTITSIADGASNTLLFGEGLGGTIPGNPVNASPGAEVVSQRDRYWAWVCTGGIPAKYGMAPRAGINKGNNGANIPGGWNFFSSYHTGLVNFALADGAVKPLRPGSTGERNPGSTDWYVFLAMSGKADGDVFDSSALMN